MDSRLSAFNFSLSSGDAGDAFGDAFALGISTPREPQLPQQPHEKDDLMNSWILSGDFMDFMVFSGDF